MIDLHFTPTPNGQKISIALEEVELPYRLISYDIFEGDQHTAAFGRINPNHKLPAIVDHAPAFGGGPHAVFESGAILQYLAEKTGRLLPSDPRARSVALQWLTWQVAGLGPMGGQAAHFMRYAPEKIPYAIERYGKELTRLLRVARTAAGRGGLSVGRRLFDRRHRGVAGRGARRHEPGAACGLSEHRPLACGDRGPSCRAARPGGRQGDPGQISPAPGEAHARPVVQHVRRPHARRGESLGAAAAPPAAEIP